MSLIEVVYPEEQARSVAQESLNPVTAKACSLPLPTRVAFVGNFLPRQCGIATFTTDLCAALAAEYGDGRLFAIPVNDPESHYEYPEQVRLELEQEDLRSYERAADFLNFNGNDLVCLQHEYGIYGGSAGRHILALLRKLKMPLVTTLHTVLREPDTNQRAVLEEIARLSDRLVVMSELAAKFLREIYAVPSGKIDIIPHGVPDLPFMDPNYFKDKFGTEGKSVLLTFGLLSPNKGIENVIQALPAILEKHPNVVYIVSGVTHPHIRRREGERYREELQALAERLGVSEHLILNNRFVSTEELVEHVGAADIYITPYLQEAQVVSGTLAIALGAGKAIISTPYWHAKELLAEKRGVIVPFAEPDAIAEAVIGLLENEAARHAMRKRAYLYSRETTWPKTARAYMRSFQRARFERSLHPRASLLDDPAVEPEDFLPELNPSHLLKMTDDTGMMQHAIFSVPNTREGYTTDDNARALVVSILLDRSEKRPEGCDYSNLSHRYLSFLWLAFHADTGRFRNFLGYDRRWLLTWPWFWEYAGSPAAASPAAAAAPLLRGLVYRVGFTPELGLLEQGMDPLLLLLTCRVRRDPGDFAGRELPALAGDAGAGELLSVLDRAGADRAATANELAEVFRFVEECSRTVIEAVEDWSLLVGPQTNGEKSGPSCQATADVRNPASRNRLFCGPCRVHLRSAGRAAGEPWF